MGLRGSRQEFKTRIPGKDNTNAKNRKDDRPVNELTKHIYNAHRFVASSHRTYSFPSPSFCSVCGFVLFSVFFVLPFGLFYMARCLFGFKLFRVGRRDHRFCFRVRCRYCQNRPYLLSRRSSSPARPDFGDGPPMRWDRFSRSSIPLEVLW